MTGWIAAITWSIVVTGAIGGSGVMRTSSIPHVSQDAD
jgi:hypothetical protein